MTSRKQFAVLFGLVFAACLVCLSLLLVRNGILAPPKPLTETLDPKVADAERQRIFAIKDLQETRAEIVKMKAHGIGMPTSPPPSGLISDGPRQ